MTAAVTAGLALLVCEPARGYRTVADLPEFIGAGRVRWLDETVHFEMTSHPPSGLDLAEAAQAVADGFGAWTMPACTAIELVNLGVTDSSAATGDGRVTVQWVTTGWAGFGFDPDAAATTDIVFALDGAGRWRIADADIFLNAERFTWSTDPTSPEERDVSAVIAHEAGHTLGMAHPCSDDGADGAPACTEAFAGLTMHPIYDGVEQRSLEPDDEAGICFLYPPVPCRTDGCPDGQACTYEGCVVVCEGLECRPGERCGPRGCTDEPCAPGSCELGCEATCGTFGGLLGDPCVAHGDCLSGYCSPARGYCTTTCSSADDCNEGARCDRDLEPRECVPEAGVLGEECGGAEDCHTGLCLNGTSASGICTRACTEAAGDCPVGWGCEVVSATPVCVPAAPRERWCRVSPGERRSSRVALLAVLLLGCGLAVGRLSIRSRRR